MNYMGNNVLMDLLTAYKKTALFISAYELGLFEELALESRSTNELLEKLKVERLFLIPLLQVLQNIGVIHEVEGMWTIRKELAMESYYDIIHHEINLYYKYLSPESIQSSMRLGMGNRHFDNVGFTYNEKQTYFKAMNGKNLNIIALLVWREIKKNTSINYLEYGRSIGGLSIYLQSKIKVINIDLVINEELVDVYTMQIQPQFTKAQPQVYTCEEFVPKVQYNLIFIYNTIHYYNPNEAMKLISEIKKTMNSESILCITDLFLKEDSSDNLVLLDWMTHGGMYYLTIKELEEFLECMHLKIYKHIYNAAISMDLLFLQINEV